jgi:uncharacterized protein YbjT (DUF2867 family)
MSNRARPILVIGTTGRHGGTGATVARILRERRVAVRALARTIDARVAPMEAIGAEIVKGDLHDRRSLKDALQGVEIAFFTYPVAPGIVDAAANFASAGRESGLKRVVVMSMAVSHPESMSHLGRAQWLAEEVLEWAGFSCLHLRIAALFFENLELLHRDDILGDGVIRNSFPDIPLNWIAGEDAGKLAVAALLFPERFEGKTTVYPTGSEQYSHTQIADLLGPHLGRTLRFERISQDAWRERLMALRSHDTRINEDLARHISAMGAGIGPFPLNGMFESVTHEKPVSLKELLNSGRMAFKSPLV